METVEHKIMAMLVEHLGHEDDDIKLTSTIRDDLGADSLDAVEVEMGLEDMFDIELSIDGPLLDKIITVSDLIAVVNKHVEKGEGE